MKKHIHFILAFSCIGVLISCNGTEEKKQKPAVEKFPVPETTEYEYTFDPKIVPSGYAVDQIAVEDTIKRVKITMEYIKETESPDFLYTEIIVTALLAEAQKELSYYDVPKNEFHTSSQFYGLVDFSVGKNFISARYVVDSYSEGAAHHNHSW
ncbi:MAG: hypothetical protein ACHQF2_07185, partial [Flavobacteriales bacterium]